METEEAVIEKIRARRAAGRAKYGETMERTDLSLEDWLRHAQEEAMDLAIYLERARRDVRQAVEMTKKIDPDQYFPEHDPLPDRCLFCGAAIVTMEDGRPCRAEDDSWVAYTCLSSVHRSRPPRKHQSTVCHALEFARLRSRITDLENEKRGLLERNGRLREIGRELVSCVEKLGTYDHDSMEVLEAKEAAISRWNEEDKP